MCWYMVLQSYSPTEFTCPLIKKTTILDYMLITRETGEPVLQAHDLHGGYHKTTFPTIISIERSSGSCWELS